MSNYVSKEETKLYDSRDHTNSMAMIYSYLYNMYEYVDSFISVARAHNKVLRCYRYQQQTNVVCKMNKTFKRILGILHKIKY